MTKRLSIVFLKVALQISMNEDLLNMLSLMYVLGEQCLTG